MPDYRAYTLGRDGQVSGSRAFVCENDEDATVWAKQLFDGHDIERWSGDRRVTCLKATEKPDAVSHEVKEGRMAPKR